MTEFDPGLLLKARGHLKIVHHVPGRIRLRFKPNILSVMPELGDAESRDAMTSLDPIDEVRVNPLAFSLVIKYDPAKLPPKSWEALLDGSVEEADAVVDLLRRIG